MRSLAAVLLLLGGLASAEDSGSLVTATVFVPPVSFVGDQVEARLTLLLPEGKSLLPPLSLPSQPWVLIRDVQVRHDPPFERVTVKYVPFAPGNRVLPPLVLGDITLENVHISTNSLLGKDVPPELLPPREQLLLPHTEILVFLLLGALVLVPLLVWRLVAPLRRLSAAWQQRLSRRRSWRHLLKEVRRLQGRALAVSGPEFYTELTHLVRLYLGARFGRDVQALTSQELRDLLGPLPPAWAAEWVRLIQRADRVRFDAQDPPGQERLEDLAALSREAAHLEGREVPSAHL